MELVDETGTTPYLGTGARGVRDILAAVNIAQIEVSASNPALSRRLIRSCVIIFSIGSKYRRFRGLKRLTRDSIAVQSHARPYEGELKRIQERSREESATNRTIGADLARRVARRELPIREALGAHQAE